MSVAKIKRAICNIQLNRLHFYKHILSRRSTETFPFLRPFSSCTKRITHLVSEIEDQIKSNEMKLRQHPGRRKIPCITLPDQLIQAAHKVVGDINQEMFEKAKDLNDQLHSRRPPVEKQEFMARSEQVFAKLLKVEPEDLTEKEWEGVTKKLKRRLFCEVNRWKYLDYDEHLCKIYLIARLGANYAAASWVFSEIRSSIPSFNPKSFFDFGSGVGSAVWAAHNLWRDKIEEYFCVDTSPDMNNLAELLLKGGEDEEECEEENSFLKTMFFRQFLPASSTIKYDLVVSAFSLLEMPSLQDRLKVIDILWRKTNDMLVVIESGNFAGYSVVLDARDYILHVENMNSDVDTKYKSGAYIVAPCPHDMPCPKIQKGSKYPCNFEVSYNPPFRQRGQTTRKEGFSFVVIRKKQRETDVNPWPRVVESVKKRHRHVHCHMCCSDGRLHHLVFSKSKCSREMYRCARTSCLGDLLPVSMSDITTENKYTGSESDSEDHIHCTQDK